MALVEDDHVVQTLAANRTYNQGLLGTPADTAAQGPEVHRLTTGWPIASSLRRPSGLMAGKGRLDTNATVWDVIGSVAVTKVRERHAAFTF